MYLLDFHCRARKYCENGVFFIHLEAISGTILESKTGTFHETLGFNNFGKSTELLLCGLLNERAMLARKIL